MDLQTLICVSMALFELVANMFEETLRTQTSGRVCFVLFWLSHDIAPLQLPVIVLGHPRV